MELIKLVDARETEGKYIVRVERDTRPTVNRLYGCNIPAYPFTFDTLEQDMESVQIEDSQMLLDVAEMIEDTIDTTREQFKNYVAKHFPTLTPAKAQEVEKELMECYASGVCGGDTDKWQAMGKETQWKFESKWVFEELFPLYRVQKLKAGHSALKTMMLDNIISPVYQPFSLTTDGRLFVIDTINADSFQCGEENVIDVTAEVFALMIDYKVIPSDEKSLGQWLNTYPKQWGGFEKATRVLADNLVRILWGYTENDCITMNVVKTARQHMNDIARIALKKKTDNITQQHILKMALEVADDVLRKHALKQVYAQDFTGADF